MATKNKPQAVNAAPDTTVAPAVARTAEEVTHWAFDNEAEGVVTCVLTFRDGTTATATAPHTGDLSADQIVASTAALAS
jgi:hypothetical protein